MKKGNDIKKVLIIGGKGNGTVIAGAMIDACAKGETDYEFCGFINDDETNIEGFPVVGKLKNIRFFIEKGFYFIFTLYKIGHQMERIALLNSLKIPEYLWFTFIHPLSYIAPNVKIGKGSVVMPFSAVSFGAEIGDHCLLMVSSSVGHNTKIENCCHIAAQACIGSCVEIRKGVHVGLNATVRENLVMGEYSVLGMGAVLLSSVPDHEIYAGNPALFKKEA